MINIILGVGRGLRTMASLAKTSEASASSSALDSPRAKYASTGQPFTVFIEGNIGSGKTTFLNHFNQYNEVCLLTEPVEDWRNLGGVNLLVGFCGVFFFFFYLTK